MTPEQHANTVGRPDPAKLDRVLARIASTVCVAGQEAVLAAEVVAFRSELVALAERADTLERERGYWEERYRQEHRTRHTMEDAIAQARAAGSTKAGPPAVPCEDCTHDYCRCAALAGPPTKEQTCPDDAGAPDVDTLAKLERRVNNGIGSDSEATCIDALDALSDLAATARERDYKLVDSSVVADRDRLARRVAELEAALGVLLDHAERIQEHVPKSEKWYLARDCARAALAGDEGGA